MKRPLGKSVLTAARERISLALDNCTRAYVSFSGGKDSTVMLDLVCREARERGIRVGLLLVDLEAQYACTIEHAERMIADNSDVLDVHWVCAEIHLRNAVSQFQPFWLCWDKDKETDWVRPMPSIGMTGDRFPFFQRGMEFEEFVPAFHEWYSQGEACACFVGIRAQESLNRFRTIASTKKRTVNGWGWTTRVGDGGCFNAYPIYDWTTEDIWTYHSAYPDVSVNEVYTLMYRAGVPLHDQRICQPYGDDQRRGLYLYQVLEPKTWGRVVARVNGANSGALYSQDSGNIQGMRKVTLPDGHTWESFANLLLDSMPDDQGEHYRNKIAVFLRWWQCKGYEHGIPDEADPRLEAAREIPSWRRVCKSLLRNDYWMKGLSFSQNKPDSYGRYNAMMKDRRSEWGLMADTPWGPSTNQLKMVSAMAGNCNPDQAWKTIRTLTGASKKTARREDASRAIELLKQREQEFRKECFDASGGANIKASGNARKRKDRGSKSGKDCHP
jgi:predicted phosphoadenosine phosphosulfate sulfurtransferase